MLDFLSSPPLPPGTVAPDWSLPDQDGKPVTLSDLRGQNVILVFYPRDETPVCRAQLCEFRDAFAEVQTHGTVVLGINPGDAKSHARFRQRYSLPFALLVDADSRVAQLYRAKGMLWTTRTVYLIGRDGRILYSKRGKPTPEEVLAIAS
jgi:peroxiredoxin Q/BCP